MMENKETVCAVVVTYNRKELLIECLDALCKQTRPIDAIYIIDNFSNDGTAELLLENGYLEKLPHENLNEPFEMEITSNDKPKIYYVRMHENTGGSGGFYEGVKRAYEKGYDWLWLMDDDTISEDDAINRLLEKANELKDVNVGFLNSKVLWTDGTPHVMNIPSIKTLVNGIPFNLYEDKNVLVVETASFVSLLLSRKVVKKIGLPLKEFFIWADDVEYTLRATRNGFLGFYIKDSIVVHKTKTNYSATNIYDWRFYYNVRNWLWIYKMYYKKRFLFYFLRQMLLTPKLPINIWHINLKACIDSLLKLPNINFVEKERRNMSIEIYHNTKVYIACPANVATGGPELLHQLAYHFRNDLSIEAFMHYYNFNINKFKSPVHPEYEFYNVPYVLEIPEEDDKEKNILIVPEILSGLLLLSKYRKIRKGVWFLSVDNYYFSRITKRDFFFQRALNKLMKLLHRPPLFDIFSENNLEKLVKKYDYRYDDSLRLADFYMTNSYRGMNWFKELKPLYYLSEYLNPEFLKTETDLSKKENIVAYNPKKGWAFTEKIISAAKDIKFVPLINMSREEVIQTLQRAKVYIDFGYHPGKDRIPREAAILGCYVITGKRGSAAFFEDVPIPEEYKFEDKEENIPKIVEKIKDCFNNFEERYKDFDYYRRVIKSEPQKFIEDLNKIFVKVEK